MIAYPGRGFLVIEGLLARESRYPALPRAAATLKLS
jgi:hypothetical protein